MSLIETLILASLLAASPATAANLKQKVTTGTRAAGKKEARFIPLDERQSRVFHTIYTHPSIPAIIEFPVEYIGTPSCGDCVDLAAPSESNQSVDALFGVQVFPAEHYVFIKPAQFSRRDGGRIPDSDFLTTLTVRLQNKLTVTLRIQYGSIEQSDARVVFTLPNEPAERKYLQEQLSEERKKLDSEYEERIAERVDVDLARLFLEPHSCASSRAREREDDIVVEIVELCRFGGRVMIRFTIENRHRSTFNIKEVSVRAGRSKEAIAIDGLRQVFERNAMEVPFKAVINGVVVFNFAQGASDEFSLTIKESGGRSRKIQLAEIGF